MAYQLAKPLLFMMDAERAHHAAFKGMGLLNSLGFLRSLTPTVPNNPVTVMGIEFANPVGLAAGLDKNGDYIDMLAELGFGSLEIGTVTPRPQAGNPKPRLFRLPEARGIINRMGFNNDGVDNLLENVARSQYRGVLGINIGKNADTPIEKAADDYLIGLRKVYAAASYVTVNISSPNTKNLRQLQQGDELGSLLSQLKAEQEKLAQQHGRYVPIAVKIAPDLDNNQIQEIGRLLIENHIDGVIATNTTLSRTGVESLRHGQEAGGLSGEPVRAKSTSVIRELSQVLDGALPIIGVGGIMNGDDAVEKIRAGAAMVQVYSGLIYEGPHLVSDCADAIAKLQSNR
ncbi:quinone-dependent dihydroorotate dehydrogenase [Chitinibacter bivalviorum]|uniref:Dihydroorotate dehydrogenase (quinone) n=1 Tax=Chitinibacter bivalviorum TaxID=2739434 RepID=A0A7H9BIS3_9NEIS|nr:quinone-dependent dihydroorotate dehydrogenase [Chitinibacter bivalviorum]QLG88550.1 quinone-dependent dihydroorotate dehydrogenase [Chitinibacter bivalviorum]